MTVVDTYLRYEIGDRRLDRRDHYVESEGLRLRKRQHGRHQPWRRRPGCGGRAAGVSSRLKSALGETHQKLLVLPEHGTAHRCSCQPYPCCACPARGGSCTARETGRLAPNGGIEGIPLNCGRPSGGGTDRTRASSKHLAGCQYTACALASGRCRRGVRSGMPGLSVSRQAGAVDDLECVASRRRDQQHPACFFALGNPTCIIT